MMRAMVYSPLPIRAHFAVSTTIHDPRSSGRASALYHPDSSLVAPSIPFSALRKVPYGFVRRGGFVRRNWPRSARWLRLGAPFHHLVDSCLRQGRFGRKTFGSTAYLAAKAKGDRSMPSKRGTFEDVYGVALRDPRDMVKAGLLEPQSPAVHKPTPRYHVCSEDSRDTRSRRTTSEAFHSGERPPYSGLTG